MSVVATAFRVSAMGTVLTRALSSSAIRSTGIRTQLTDGVKVAMKARDTFNSTLLRSVLAEVYSADKTANEKVPDSTIVGILRKAIARRNDSATQYAQASRPELAAKEESEAAALSKFLPPQLTEVEITKHLNEAYDKVVTHPPSASEMKKVQGLVMKELYQAVDKANVDPESVKRCLQEVLKSKAGTSA